MTTIKGKSFEAIPFLNKIPIMINKALFRYTCPITVSTFGNINAIIIYDLYAFKMTIFYYQI